LVCCIAIAVVCFLAAISQSALLQVKGGDTWFLADGMVVRTMQGDWSIDQSLCVKDAASSSDLRGFKQNEISVICDAYKNSTLKKVISDTVKQQQIFGVLYGALTLIFIIVLILSFASVDAAKKVKEKLESGNGAGDSIGASQSKKNVRRRGAGKLPTDSKASASQ
jgi:hypothetical protein